ncbi:MAG: hypothetical protein K1X81_07845 [Bacteroidia bacterium]|nr:hypothetical protein [Bacteroidia bacterium]
MKIRNSIIKVSLCLIVFAFVFSCHKDVDLPSKSNLSNPNLINASSQTIIENDSPTAIVLGAQLTNPYTVSNMQSAFTALTTEDPEFCSNSINVRTTHYYVKFKPQNEDDVEALIDDSTLILYDYPLDRPIVNNGNYYKDPTLSETTPNYQYACVPYGFSFPNVQYEILANLYIPEEDPLLEYTDDSELDICIDKLVYEALSSTGNLDTFNIVEPDTNAPEPLFSRRSKWNPSGIIRYHDNTLIPPNNTEKVGWKGLEGVKVRVRRWFTSREALTDMNGYFYINEKFRRDVNYSIKWERQNFQLNLANAGQLYIDGPKQTGAWVLNIGPGLANMISIVHMAAMDYYYKCYYVNLTSPPLNTFFTPRLNIGIYYENNTSNDGDCRPWARTFGIYNTIRIYNPVRQGDEIYGTAIHEMAHFAHWGIVGASTYNNASGKLQDSWCRLAQWTFANKRYKNLYGLTNFEHHNGWQFLNVGYQPYADHMHDGYTPVFIDLVDTYNQYVEKGNNAYYAIDPISGFTAKEVEDALPDCQSLNDMKAKLDQLNKTSSTDLNNLFSYYNNI